MANSIVDRVALILPPTGSLIPAIMTFENAQLRLGFTPQESFVIAAVVEGLGFASITTTLDIFEQDQAEGRGFTAQFWMAAGGTGVYLLVIILVNAIMDPGDWIRKVTIGLLALLAVIGGLMVALRNQLQKRRDASSALKKADEDEKAEERAHRREVAAEKRRLAHELKLQQVQAGSQPNSLKVTESDTKVAEGDEERPETYGKWRRWPDLLDVYKAQIAETIRQARALNAATYKKIVVVDIMKKFGVDERVGYTWIQYAERDYPMQDQAAQGGETPQDDDGPIILDGGDE